MNNVDLVTITCSRDRGIQELQSYSLNLMVTNPCDHYVVVEDYTVPIEEWYARLAPYYTRHRLHLISSLLDTEYYINDSQVKNGWHRSAVLKLLISEKVQANKYLIFDSKNFFICKQSLDEWPVADGNGLVQNFDSWGWTEVEDFCLTNNIPLPNEVYSSATPFMVDTKIARKIISYNILPLFFNKKEWWSSELFLYSIFTQFAGNKLTTSNTPNVTFWNSERPLSEQVLIDISNWPGIKTFGLHREVFKFNPDLTDFTNFLVNRGFELTAVEKILNLYKKDTSGR